MCSVQNYGFRSMQNRTRRNGGTKVNEASYHDQHKQKHDQMLVFQSVSCSVTLQAVCDSFERVRTEVWKEEGGRDCGRGRGIWKTRSREQHDHHHAAHDMRIECFPSFPRLLPAMYFHPTPCRSFRPSVQTTSRLCSCRQPVSLSIILLLSPPLSSFLFSSLSPPLFLPSPQPSPLPPCKSSS